MAGRRIPALPTLSASDLVDADLFVVFDVSGNVTAKITKAALAEGVVGVLPFTPTGSVTATTLDGAVTELANQTIDLTAASITSGTINNVVIGGVTPAAATFTTITVTGVADVNELELGTPLAIEYGGTSQTTAAAALAALGGAASGANTDITSLADGTTVNGLVLGYRRLRVAGTVTPTSADRSSVIFTGTTVTINGGEFVAGDVLLVVNTGASPLTITFGGGALLRLAGSSATGDRTVPAYGVAPIVCAGSDVFYVGGPGVT